MPEERSNPWHLVPVLGVLGGLALYRLLVMPLAPAERLVLELSETPLRLASVLQVGLLFGLLVEQLARLGADPARLRLLVWGTGLMAVALAQPVMRRLGGAHATPGALLLGGTAPLLVLATSQLDSGVLVLACGLAWLLCFLEATRTGAPGWLLGWAAASLLAICAHPLSLALLPVQWVAVLVYRSRYRLRAWVWWPAQLLPLAAALVLYGALLPLQQDEGAAALHVGDLLSGGTSAAAGVLPLPVVACLVALALPGLAGLWACRDWRRDPRHGLLLALLAAPVGLWLLGSHAASQLLLPLLCLALLAAIGLRVLPRWLRQLSWAAVGAAYLLSYWLVLP